MKRFIFSAIALMVAATACTESGIVDMPEFYGNPIVFDTYIGKTPITKADNVDINYLKGLDPNGNVYASAIVGAQVYAYPCDPDATTLSEDIVDFSSAYLDGKLLWSGGTWQYNVLYNGEWVVDEPYMPSGKDLAVVAYNLGAMGCVSEVTSRGFNFTVMDQVAQQVDLLATPLTFVSENENGVTQVPIRFYHLLSRVGFKVLSTNSSDAEIHISSITLRGAFPKNGYVNLTASIASPAASTDQTSSPIDLTENIKPFISPLVHDDEAYAYAYEYSLFSADESFSITSSACVGGDNQPGAQPIYGNKKKNNNSFVGNQLNRYMMIMPGEYTHASSIEVKYRIGDSNEENFAKVDLNDISFAAGKAYEFVLKIATAVIDFSAEVIEGEDWTTPSSSDLN